jgi:hypothetical protein
MLPFRVIEAAGKINEYIGGVPAARTGDGGKRLLDRAWNSGIETGLCR